MTFEQAKDFLLRRARERGVDVEVLGSSERQLSINASRGRVEELTHATQGGVGVRALVDGKVGYASTEQLDDESLEWALDEAVENAALQARGGAVMLEGRALGRHDLIGEGLSAPVETKTEGVLTLERSLTDDPRVVSTFITSYRESEQQAIFGSTRGADGGYRNGYAYYLAGPVMREGDSTKQGWELDFGKEFHALDPGRTSQNALERVGRHLGARPLPTGRYRAYFEPEVTANLLSLLAFGLSGKTLAEGKSLFANDLGARIGSELLTIVDDPTLPDGPASRPFDAEGTPAARTVLVEEGVLRSFLHNSDTARRTGQANTGHAARSYASTLGVAPTNLTVEPGAALAIDDGVLVTDLMGVHAGANPISGDVSVQGFGLLVEGGEMRPVDNFAISFNLRTVLQRVVAVGDDVKWIPLGGIFGVPTIAIDALSFGGA